MAQARLYRLAWVLPLRIVYDPALSAQAWEAFEHFFSSSDMQMSELNKQCIISSYEQVYVYGLHWSILVTLSL